MKNAKALRRKADTLAKEAIRMMEGIPPGQPVMSARDRNRREKSWEMMRKAAEIRREAEAAEQGPV